MIAVAVAGHTFADIAKTVNGIGPSITGGGANAVMETTSRP